MSLKLTARSVFVIAALLVAACRQSPAPAASSTAAAAPGVVPAAARQANQPLPTDVAAIVDAYRKIIVLVEDETSLTPDERQRASVIGRMLFQQNHERLTTLTDRLASEVSGNQSPAQASAFLDILESSGELRDADKLAFMDLVTELIEVVREAPAGAAGRGLLSRLESDLGALKQIQALYDKELEKIFGRFETRGMTVQREAWGSYVAFLKSRYRVADILRDNGGDLDAAGTRSAGAAPAASTEVTGTRLPPKTLVLTFDDGPHARYTDRIREILKKHDVPAIFFHVGQNIATYDANKQVKATRAKEASVRLVENGFVLANHTFAHELLPKLSETAIARQIEDADKMLRTVADPPSPLFRAPYGARNPAVHAAVQSRNLKSIMWNIDSMDWADPVPQSIANRVIQKAEGEGRGIILFHDIQARTIEALPAVIETLKSRGFQFVGWDGTTFAGGTSTSRAAGGSPGPAPRGGFYRESWAVVVGIDNYRHWPRLSYAGNDARAMRDLLVDKFGFKPQNVKLLLNEEATRDRILSAIGDALADPARVAREDRVLVFFAGHGATRQLPNGRALGYIVPIEADLANYQGQSISMTNFQDISEAIPAKHVFFITDACYSGIAATRGTSQNFLQEMTRRAARQVLTAGGADQQVADNGPNGHSIFTWTLLQGLEGRADLNSDSLITASELAAYVGPTVSSLSRQTPAFANLAGSEGGEFIFELKHETEFLSEESRQLEEEGIRLNAELDKIRAEVAARRARNDQLRQEIAAAKAALEGGTAAAPPPTAKTAPPLERGGATPMAPLPVNATAAQWNDRGTALFREKRYEEALAAFQEATKRNPANALAANNLGYAYLKLEKNDLALEWFEQTLKLDPKRAIAYGNLGDAYLALGKREEAKRAYERYLEFQPNTRYAETVRQKLAQLTQGE